MESEEMRRSTIFDGPPNPKEILADLEERTQAAVEALTLASRGPESRSPLRIDGARLHK